MSHPNSLQHRFFYGSHLLLAIVMIVSMLGIPVSNPASSVRAASPATPIINSVQAYTPHVVLVGLKPGASIDAVLRSPKVPNAVASFTTANPVFPFAQAARTGNQHSIFSNQQFSPLARIYKLRLAPGVDVATTIKALSADPNVEYAEPDYVAQRALTPNDPQYGSQWGLSQIGAPTAWDVTTGAVTTTIAIVDSGLDTTHEDFAGKLWVNPGEIAGNGIDDDGNGLIDDVNGWNFIAGNNDLTDENGHGTEVAGIAAAASNNGQGIAGVCWACRVMVVKVMQSSGIVNYSDVAAGVAYAAGSGANVINLSLGGYADSTTLRTAIESAAQTAVVVAGAGNDNKSALFYPAAYPSAIAVVATDSSNVKASFSNFGSWVDVAAPGVNVLTTMAGGNSYGNSNGTSLSSPFVAGVAGLIHSQHPDWSAALVREHLLNTGTSIDGTNPTYAGQLGHGLLNANAALNTAAQPQMTVSGWTLDGQANARPDKNKTYQLAVTLLNTWLPARSVVGTLSTSTSGVTITDNSGMFGDLNTGQSKTNSTDTFSVTFGNSLSYGQLITFTLNLSGADGYSLNVPFTLQVRSGVVTWPGNATIITNTTWYADQMYVITTTVKVNPGITLTIQPGTVVRSSISGTLRIDGTLIAQGTVEQPIVFDTYPAGTQAGAISFVDTSVQSTWDENGQYMSGSVIRHVDMIRWIVRLGTRSISVADSAFDEGTIMAGTNNDAGAPRVERNTFTHGATVAVYGGQAIIKSNIFTSDSGTALILTGGAARVEQNTITGYGTAISGSGTHAIISNSLTNNAGMAISFSGGMGSNAPVIHDNYIVGNAGAAIYGSQLQRVDIEHNLIANNGGTGGMCPPACGGGAAVALDVQSSNTTQSSPALAYNPDRDEYLLTWNESNVIKAQRVLSDGQTAGAIIDVGPGYFTSVVYNPTQHEYLVAGAGGAMGLITTQRVSQYGALIGNATIITTTAANTVRVVHQSADNTYLAVWKDYSASPIYAQRVLTDGTASSTLIQVGADVSNLSLGDVAYDPAQNRTLVTFRGDYYDVVTGWCWGCVLGTWVTPIDTGSVATFKVGSPSNLYNPSVTFGGDRFFSAWERSTATNSLYGQIITDSVVISVGLGLPQTAIYTDTGSAYTPRVGYASSTNQFLTVWAHRPAGVTGVATQLYGQRILTDGVPVGGVLPISALPVIGTPAMGTASIALAYNTLRNEYLIVWVDGQRMSQIYGQRISANGQLLDNAWTTADETDPTVNFQLTSARGVRYNTILNNKGYGLQVSGSAAGQVNVAHNNLIGNATYDVYLSNGTQNMTVTATSNYWGIDPTSIPSRIHDCEFDDPNGCAQTGSVLGKVAYDPPLDAPAPEAPGYINAVAIAPTNGAPGDPIGIGRATIDITFTRSMITSTAPAISFHDARRGTLETMSTSAITGTPYSMAPDALGRMWFGFGYWGMGTTPGTVVYDGTNWTAYNTSNSGLADNGVSIIYGASNGDVWFGHNSSRISRLQGTTWITYGGSITGTGNILLGSANAIGEDGSGKIWFGDGGGAISFDGTHWQRYTTADGLENNNVSKIARDGQGRMWFGSGNSAFYLDTLSVFDGVAWTIYDQSHGLPGPVSIGALFADSRGRIWVGLYSQDNTQRVAMFDAGTWTYFTNSTPQLNCSPNVFTEDSAGRIWMSACGSIAIYDNGQWSSRSDLNINNLMLFDARGNLWMSAMSPTYLRVLWGGADYPVVDNAQWLSPTHFRATYDVTPIIPKGTYVINASGALASDGMLVAPHTTQTFLVDYAGFVTDGTPPTKPIVTAQGDGTLTTLSFSWSSSDAESGIDQYRYAIGTTTGGRDVVDWTYVGRNTTSVTRNGLLLIAGQTYYVTVAARNAQGLWSQNGVSNPVIAGATPDSTPPNSPTVTASGNGTLTTLMFSWTPSTDPESGILQYRYAIGTTAGGQDLIAWTNVPSTTTNITRNGLTLVNGQTYYVTVQAQNGAGLWSANGVSNGVVATTSTDTTPPTAPSVTAYGNGSLTTLSFSWTLSSDPESGVQHYRYAIGTTAGGQQVISWTIASVITSTFITRNDLALIGGQTYYVTMQAQNGAGLWSANGVSNGVVAGSTTKFLYLPLIKK